MMLKPGLANTVLASGNSGMEMFLSEMIETSASCTSGTQRVISSKRSSPPVRIATIVGDGIRLPGLGPSAMTRAIFHGILDVFFGGARRALDGERGTAGNGRREMFAEPALAGARIAHQQQCAVGSQRDNGPLDNRRIAEELPRNLHLLLLAVDGRLEGFSTDDVRQHRAGSQFPGQRRAARLILAERFKLIREEHFGR